MIIQSYWSLPSQIKIKDDFSRDDGGWLNEKYHAMSWALSCLKWKELYGEIILYTDEIGKKWLIDELELPYSKVEICLDKFNDYNSLLWALPKLYVYSLQDKPFLHVDSDVYIWNKLSENYLKNSLICQNMEYNFPYYKDIINEIHNHFNFVPTDLKNITQNSFTSINAGIIGGTNTDFYKKLFNLALEFVDKNQDNLSKVNAGLLNVIFEQLFFYQLANKQKEFITPLFKDVSSQFSELIQFNLSPFYSSYIHTVGHAKKNKICCFQVEQRLKYEYPNTYYSIEKYYQQRHIKTAKPLLVESTAINKKISDKLMNDIIKIQTNISILRNTENSKFDFDTLYNNSIDSILKLKFSLNQQVIFSTLSHQFPPFYNFNDVNENDKIIEISSMEFVFYKDHTGEVKFEPLKSWNTLLQYFRLNDYSIKGLIDKTKPIWNQAYSGKNFDFDILNFIMINFVYKNILYLKP